MKLKNYGHSVEHMFLLQYTGLTKTAYKYKIAEKYHAKPKDVSGMERGKNYNRIQTARRGREWG